MSADEHFQLLDRVSGSGVCHYQRKKAEVSKVSEAEECLCTCTVCIVGLGCFVLGLCVSVSDTIYTVDNKGKTTTNKATQQTNKATEILRLVSE